MSLQGNSYDVYQAVNRVYDLLPSLSEIKNSIDSHHQTWFQEAVALASKQVPSLQPPLNVHYREDISKGAIEHCIAEMEGLSQDVLSAVRCLQVVPYVMSKVEGCCNNTEFVKVFQESCLTQTPSRMSCRGGGTGGKTVLPVISTYLTLFSALSKLLTLSLFPTFQLSLGSWLSCPSPACRVASHRER